MQGYFVFSVTAVFMSKHRLTVYIITMSWSTQAHVPCCGVVRVIYTFCNMPIIQYDRARHF